LTHQSSDAVWIQESSTVRIEAKLIPKSDVMTTRNYDHLLDRGLDASSPYANLKDPSFQFLTYCVPKSISEPWLGDICEMREDMHVKGYSQRAITWATISQLALLVLHWGVYKALDVLMPFKKSKIE
jgi:hypothetical protein